VARSRDWLLAAKTVAWRAGSSHSKVVLRRGLLALLLAPQPPRDNSETANEDRTTDSADDATDDGFGLRRHGAAAAAAGAAFGESRVDGCGCYFGGGDDAGAGDQARADGAIFGEIGGCGEGFGGFADDV
jgi:hypothetical protein